MVFLTTTSHNLYDLWAGRERQNNRNNVLRDHIGCSCEIFDAIKDNLDLVHFLHRKPSLKILKFNL